MRSHVQTCEAALLLASLCSTVDSLPPTKRPSSHMINDMVVDMSSNSSADSSCNNQLLQAYITERAVKQHTIKQHQSYNNRTNIIIHNSIDMSSVNSIHQNQMLKSNGDAKVTTSSSAITMNTVPSPPISASLPPTSSSSLKLPAPVHSVIQNSAEDSTTENFPTKLSLVVTSASQSVGDSSISDLSHPIAKENALDILAKTSLASDAAKKQALKLSSSSPNSRCTSSSNGSPNKKLKAEFLPPSSGPSPSYVRLVDVYKFFLFLVYCCL